MTNQLLVKLGERLNIQPEELESVLKKTVFPARTPVSNEQFVMFLSVAIEYNLNPLTKEIYAFPTRGGGIQPIVSVDGWMKIINSHLQFDGMEFIDRLDDKNNLISVTCKIFRKDRGRPTEVTEYLSECRKPTDSWKQWPSRMLRHKAAIQGARYAFNLSGIIDPDEAERYRELKIIKGGTSTPAVNKVMQKLGHSEPDICIDTITQQIMSAENMDDLCVAADLAKSLEDESDKQQARDLYKKKLDEIKEE